MLKNISTRVATLAAILTIILITGLPTGASAYSVKEVSKELEVHANSLYRWVNEYEQYGEKAFPGHGSAFFNAQYEIRKLQKENEVLREELEILKKFRGFLKKKKP